LQCARLAAAFIARPPIKRNENRELVFLHFGVYREDLRRHIRRQSVQGTGEGHAKAVRARIGVPIVIESRWSKIRHQEGMEAGIVRVIPAELEVFARGTEFEDGIYATDRAGGEFERDVGAAVEPLIPIRIVIGDGNARPAAWFDRTG
jgi:hypothetical protein